MKKISLLLIVAITVSMFITPFTVHAKTIKEFEEEVNKFTEELQSKENQIAANDAEVASIQQRMVEISSQISEVQNNIDKLQQEIEEANVEIAEKSTQSKELFQYLQISEGENAYLEYIFGATDITDMIYRMSIVEQLTEYNDQIMTELSNLVEANKNRKTELANQQTELENLNAELESEKQKINADTAAIRESMPSVQEQLEAAKSNLEYYQNLGCGENEDIQDCQYRIAQQSGGSGALPPSVSGFYRPMVSGYVTQNWSGYGGHLGMDFSNSNKTIEIYPIATGVVFSIYYDTYGALCVKIRHNVNGSYLYSTYAHLSSFGNISVGQVVTPNTVIGRMGNTGYSFGSHLHLEITTCDWHTGGGCTWSEYQHRSVNPRNYIGFPTSLRTLWSGR